MENLMLQIAPIIGAGIGAIMLFALLGMIVAGIAVFLFVFWILMIVDCVQRKFKNETDKIVWIILLVFLHILGAIIYYFVVKRRC